jgi:hypothetical protein
MSTAGALAAQGNMAAAKKEMGQATKYLTSGSGTLLGAAAGHPVGALIGALAGSEGGPFGMAAGAAAGGTIATLLGGAGGFAAGKIAETERDPSSTMRQIADQIASDKHLGTNFAKLLFGMMEFETGGGTNNGVSYDNFAGLKDKYGNYQHFATPQDFAKTFERVLSMPRYAGVFGAQDADQLAAILKRGSFYTDDRTGKAASASAYAAGIEKYGDTYNQYDIDVNVAGTNASASEIAAQVKATLRQEQGAQVQRNLVNGQGSY